MKKQALDKMKLFFMGINSRYLEQKDFFIKAEFTFTSGTKQFKGEYVNINDELRYIFKGESQSMSFQDMLNKLTSEAALYDSLNLRYIQRGTIVVIEANDKQVTTRNEDASEEFDADSQISNSREYYIKSSKSGPLLKDIGIIMLKRPKIRDLNKNDIVSNLDELDEKINNCF